MADVLGLSVASASIAAVQLVATLRSMSPTFFKFSFSSKDAENLQVKYQKELLRIQALVQVCSSENQNSASIPMRIFEELHLELREQAVALELFEKEYLGSATSFTMASSRGIPWALRDKRLVEGFINDLRRHVSIFQKILHLASIKSRMTPHSSLQPESLAPSAESSLGLKVVRTPKDANISVDIIFIHGLQARSLATWSGVGVFWPGDLLGDELPNARILTFDYDFGPSSPVTKRRVLLEAEKLIRDIERFALDTGSRCPLVFCAHSFGGLLLKSAMTYGHRAQIFEGILARTKGALFFGVPTPIGSSTSWLGEYLNKILGSEHGINHYTSIDIATKFEELFRADSELFHTLSRSRGWSSFSFYESKPTLTRSGHVFITAVRDTHPAGHFGVLPGHHYTMCRFQKSDDVGFSVVSRCLKMVTLGEQIPSLCFNTVEVPKTKGEVSDILESTQTYNKSFDRYIKLLKDQQGPQNLVLPETHQSAAWLDENKKFQSWSCGDTRRFTICGAPGSGKTHLVRYIVNQLKSKKGFRSPVRDRDVLVHFVGCPPAPTSVLRSFLFQLLKSNSDLFKQVYNRMHDPPLIYEDLEQLLVDLLSNSRLEYLEIIIHGIDSMDKSSRDQVGGTILRLVSAKRGMPHVKVLLSTRTCDIFSKEIEHSLSKLGLSHSTESTLDLKDVALDGKSSGEFEAYIKQCIAVIPNAHKWPSKLQDLVEKCLVTKTMGSRDVQKIEQYTVVRPKSLLNNYLWISLVADLIGSQQSPSKIKELLREATEEFNDLDSVYEGLIGRTVVKIDIDRILRFIQYARRPMSLQELAFAIAIREQHLSAQSVADDQFFSLDASALVLFQNDTVSLIHPSLSDHLERPPKPFNSHMHQELAKACLWSLFLGARAHTSLASPKAKDDPSDDTFFDTSTHPFMHYASEFWFKHVQVALPDDADGQIFNLTKRFVASDSWTSWKLWYGQLHGKDSFPSDTSLVHIFAALDLLSHPETFKLLSPNLNEQDASGKSVIYYAAANDAQATIDFILDKHENALFLDAKDQELLHLAVTRTNLRLLEKILRDPYVEIPQSLLITAIDGRHWSAFEFLKQHLQKSWSQASWSQEKVGLYWANLADQNGGALHHAVRARNLALVEMLLRGGESPNNEKGGKTPLHLSAQIGDELITEALIMEDGDVNRGDAEQGNNPLHYATEVGSVKVVRLLMNYGVEIAAPNSKKQTAIHVAARCGHDEICVMLLACGSPINGKDADGMTPLHLACAGNWNSVVRTLLAEGGDFCANTDKSRTPLHLTATNGSREAAIMLLKAYADVNARDLALQTPLHAAVQRGSVDLVLTLARGGADPSAIDKYGKSPLHYAVTSGDASAKIVQLLIECGADVELRDKAQQKTALDFAQAEGNNVIAALLESSRQILARAQTVCNSGSWIIAEPLQEGTALDV